jgi:hypothetical protein
VITALIAAAFLLALGVAAKGAIAHALIIAAAWLTKNILLLGFLRTPTGQRTARSVRRQTYARLKGPKRRLAYRVFDRLSRGEAKIVGMASRLFRRKG